MKATRDNLNSIMEFDHVVKVTALGEVLDGDIQAPELSDGQLESPIGSRWNLLSGYTGQYGYRGPIMHNSEFIGGRMADDILAEPGFYVALVDYPADDSEPDGWAVAKLDS